MTTQNEAVQAVYQYAAGLVKSGMSASQVESKLVEKGLDRAAASIVVKKLFALRAKAVGAAAKKNMLYGALWCIGGILVTAVTFSAAGKGGTYVVAWGAIIFGGIQFFRGLFQYMGQ